MRSDILVSMCEMEDQRRIWEQGDLGGEIVRRKCVDEDVRDIFTLAGGQKLLFNYKL